jgi:GNAT superfamily N-acetyltransferase
MSIEVNIVSDKKYKYLVISYIVRNQLASKLEASLIKREDIHSTKYGVNLRSIETSSSFQGKGIATKLINKLIEVCIELGYAYIILDDATDSLPPRNLYYKLGFLVKDDNEKWVNWTLGIEPYDEERLLRIY